MKDGWKRVTKSHPCPVCKRPNESHRSCWCMYSTDGAAAICPFVSERASRDLGAAGFLHRLNGHTTSGCYQRHAVRPAPARITNWDALVDLYCAAVGDVALQRLADGLGVSAEALTRLHIGLCGPDTWTFPMSDGQNVVGVRTRTGAGDKKAIYGSRNGLFVPDDIAHPGLPILICEGPTDTAAMLSIGFDAIGRADCNSLVWTERICYGRMVVIVADKDMVGMRGAALLAKHLGKNRIESRIIVPPAKDARAWVNGGATSATVNKQIGIGG